MRTTYYPFIDESTPEGSKTLSDSAQDQIDFGVGISSNIGIGTVNNKFAQFAIHFDGSEDNRTGGFEINANSNSSGDKHGARILAYNRVKANRGYRRLRFAASEYQFETPDNPTDTSAGGPRVNITGFGSVGIGTTDPLAQLDVRGDARFSNKIYDKDGDSGTSGQVLSSTGTQVDWVNVGTLSAGSASQVAVTASDDDQNFNVTFVDSSSGNQSIKADTNSNFIYNPSINRLELNTFSGTGFMLSGSGSEYVGMQLKTSDSSATVSRNIFIDTVNELGNAVANQVGSVQSDGGSHWRWETQPPGDRTDRRVERLRIAADGNVGIGTTSPSVKLDVIGSATVEGDLFLREVPSHGICKINADGNLNLHADALVRFYESDNNKLMFTFDVNTTHNDARMYMEGDSDTFFNHPESNQLGFTAGGTETIRIKAGKLGIGIINPTQSLDVNGGIRAFTDADNLILLNSSDGSIELKRSNGPFIDFANSSGDDHDCRIKQENNDLAFTTGGQGSANEKLRITASGITSIRGANNQDNFQINVNSSQFAVRTNDGVGEISLKAQDGTGGTNSKYMTFFTQATGQSAGERLRITEIGNVGINSTNPNSKLTIASGSATAQIEIQRTNSSGAGTIGALNFTAVTGYSVANISAIGQGDNDGAHLVFRTTDSAGEHSPFGGSTIERLRIDSGGQVIFKPMTTTQRDALTAQTGGVIFNSSTSKLQVYNGSAWVNLN